MVTYQKLYQDARSAKCKISLLVVYICRISNIPFSVSIGNQTHIPVTLVTGNYLNNDKLKCWHTIARYSVYISTNRTTVTKCQTFFMCRWPCILVIFDFMFQLNAPFLYYIYHIPLHVSSNFMLILRRIHCIHTASGSLYVTLLRWPLSAQAVRGHVEECAKCNKVGTWNQILLKCTVNDT